MNSTYDNRKKVTLANGRTFLLPPWCIRETYTSTTLTLTTGDRMFANWYVTIH